MSATFAPSACRALLFGLLLAVSPLAAQTVTATLTGTVTDPAAATVAGAAITATHVETNTTRRVLSNESGDYTITNLRPGVYRIVAERAGFKKTVVEGVQLQVEQTARVDLTLQLGEVSEIVEVTAAAAVVASETSSVGQVINQTQVANLPLKGRNFYELALLAPGTTPQMPGSFVGGRRPTPGGLNAPAFYVGGGRETSNGYLMDGVDAQDPHYLTPSVFPSVDAIQEFKLQTNAYSAEYGRFAAQVNATTRSGTNQYRGSLYEFFRNDKLDAAGFFANFSGLGKAPLRYNQFGGTLGGPLSLPRLYQGKDRTFFFVNYEGTRIRRGRTAQLNVPTAQQRSGDFTPLGFRGNQPIFDPATTRSDSSGRVVRDPFAANRIPQSRIGNFAKTVLGLYPLPVVETARGNNFFAGLSDNSDNNQLLTRIDHRLNDNNNLFFRYSFFDGLQSNKSPIDQGGTNTDVRTQNMALNYTRILNASALYELRLGYNRPTYLILQEGAFEKDFASQLGIRNLLSDPIAWGVPQVNITGFSGIGSDTNPTTQVSNVYQLVNHLTLTRGPHSAKFGADMRKTNYNDRSERFVRGSFTFTGGMTADPQQRNTGVSVADLLLGLPLSAGGSNSSLAGNFNGFTYSFFAQDDWKVSRNLTLNLGIRYEFNTRYTDVQNRLVFFDQLYPGGRLLVGGTSQAYIPGQGLVPGVKTPRGLVPADTNNWAPRVGLAWRPFGHNRTAVRAGYGIFYSIVELQELRTWVRNPPFGEVVGLAGDQNAAANSPNALRVEELFPARGSLASRPNAYSPARDFPDPYYQQWNFTLQQEIRGQTLVEAGYMGSKGTRLIQRLNANQATLDADPSRPTPILSRRPFPAFGNSLRIGDPVANSTYHAGILRLERRFSGGFSFLTSYTFAKSLDDASLIDVQPRDIRNRSLNKGRSQFDIRHRLVASASWETPFGKGKAWVNDGALAYILGGWQMNGILSTRSGFPFSVTVQGDVCNCGASGQLADQVGDPRHGFTQSRLQWFNTAAFALPRTGTFGTSGRNILDGPGSVGVDFSVFRTIPAGERMNLQFRGEFFNLFNRVNFGQPNAQVGSAVYGVIQGAGDARIIQLALKLRF